VPDRRIRLKLEGLDSENGHVLLGDLVDWLRLQHQVLVRFDRLVGLGHRASKFPVVGLSHSSPATAIVAVRPIEEDNDLSKAVVARYVGAVEGIAKGRVPEDLDAPTLEALRSLALPVGRKMKRASISSGKKVVDLTEHFVANVDQALSRVDRSMGSIEGVVEHFNAHAGANVFHVYPLVGPTRVTCHFAPHLLDRAASAVMRKVRVYGELHYLRHSDFPHAMNVSEIDVYEVDEALPRFSDLRGTARGATGDLSSEDFVSRERDAWED
jgi:hypothetical protein